MWLGLVLSNMFSEELKRRKEMSKVSYILLNDSVVINMTGDTQTVRKGDMRYEQVIECIRENRLDDIPDLLDVETAFANKGLTLKDGVIYINDDALPGALSDRIIQLVEDKMPIDIMVKFWNNLKQNPSFNSRQMLYKFLEHNGHPLTPDGCFIAYRGVTDDFKDRHTRKFDNSVGQVVEMDRSKVDDNPENTCSAGLHVAAYDYAYGFGPKRIEVKVNPKDVVAVPKDYNGTKMRVCKFEVMAECESIRTESVVSYDDNDIERYEDNLEDNECPF